MQFQVLLNCLIFGVIFITSLKGAIEDEFNQLPDSEKLNFVLKLKSELEEANRELLVSNRKLLVSNRKLLASQCGSDYRIAHNWIERNFMNWEFITLNSEYIETISQHLEHIFVDTYSYQKNISSNRLLQVNDVYLSFLQVTFLHNVYDNSEKQFKWMMFSTWVNRSNEYLNHDESKRLDEFVIEVRKLLQRGLTIENLLSCISFHLKLSTKTAKLDKDVVDGSMEYRWMEYTIELYETFITIAPEEIRFEMKNEVLARRICGELFRRTITGIDPLISDLKAKEVEPFPKWLEENEFEPDNIKESLNRAAKLFWANRTRKKQYFHSTEVTE